MNPNYTFGWQVIAVLAALLTGSGAAAQAPTHTGKFAPVLNENINGFYEYLPRNYAADINTRYPLLVFFHAAGERGTGTAPGVLEKITAWGVPKLIKTNAFPDSFYTGGQWHKYIVISPQIKESVNWTVVDNPEIAPAVNAVIEYAKAAYRVDPARIYLCGMSMGGSIAWSFAGSTIAAANQLAAVVVACGAGDLTAGGANAIAAANLPVMATHNRGDRVVNYERTMGNAALINAYTPRITPQPAVVTWEGGDHNVWSRTFEDTHPGQTSQGLQGNLRDTLGINIYEWMLQFTRAGAVLPVYWQRFDIQEADGAAALRWTVSQAINTAAYTVERSNDGSSWRVLGSIPARDTAGVQQEYRYTDRPNSSCFYRIRLTDKDGKISYSSILQFTPLQLTAGTRFFPNPFQDKLVIQSAGLAQNAVRVQLLSATGQLVLKQQYPAGNNNDIVIDNLGKLPRGVYYAVVETGNGTGISRMRVVKEQ